MQKLFCVSAAALLLANSVALAAPGDTPAPTSPQPSTPAPADRGGHAPSGLMRYDKGEFSKAQFNFKRATGYPDIGLNAHIYLGRI